MRGFPPIQLALLVIAFAALAIPLSHLTGNPQHEPQAPAPAKKTETAVHALLRLRYAHLPTHLSLKLGGKELITVTQESPIEVDTTLPGIKDGIEVLLNATWPENTPDTAITLEVEPDGLEARRETRWSSASSLDEVLSFSWK